MDALESRSIDSLRETFPDIKGEVLFDEPMSLHTSFKIGGPADIFAVVQDTEDLQALVKWAGSHSVSLFILGGGTNLLVSDEGIRSLVVQLGTGFSDVHIRGLELTAGAGAKLSRCVRRTLGIRLCGMEGLVGIPGTVGGAVCMNAGTPIGCVKDSLVSIRAIDAKGRLKEIPADDLVLRYRGSDIPDNGLIVTEATFELRRESEADRDTVVQSLMSKRKRSQPIGTGTAGSVFKNPPDGYAGQLLEAVGAKGMQVGGARVSSKHANFIENTGIATAEEVRSLMIELQGLVRDRFGIELEPEIQMVGEWD